MADHEWFDPWLKRWALVPDGIPIITPGSKLLPVRQGDVPAMLKVAVDDEEKYGNLLMTWWDGEATRIMCRALGRLHAPRPTPPDS